VDYQPIGSGGGIENFIGGRLDFAGSDLQLTEEGVGKVEGGVVQIPLTAGAIVLAYNLPGVDGLRLSREAFAGIFLGTVARWDDPLIRASNEGLDLPDTAITVVARADASGTTLATTRHLSAISEQFARTVGASMTPVWPEALKQRGALIRGKTNAGVAAYVKSVPGSIGYVQYAYAHLTNLPMAILQNREGDYVAAGRESFEAAVRVFGSELDLVHEADPKGSGSYPIFSLSWLLLRKTYDGRKGHALKDVVRYCLTEGQAVAHLIGYIPFSGKTVDLLLQRVDAIQ
jgi:phosphate transport system substrate-binding protein